MKLKTALGSAALAVGLGVGGLALAPVALADEDSYLADINQGIGAIEVVPGQWLDLGYAACNIGNLEDATNYIYSHTGGATDLSESQFAAESAFMFLC